MKYFFLGLAIGIFGVLSVVSVSAQVIQSKLDIVSPIIFDKNGNPLNLDERATSTPKLIDLGQSDLIILSNNKDLEIENLKILVSKYAKKADVCQ